MNPPLRDLQTKLGYEFNDLSLLELALTHRSKGSSNYERLEFLGDAILGFVVADMLYEHFAAAPEGQLSRFRAALVRKDTLAEMARQFSLGDFLLLGSGELKSGGFRRSSILADAMEAIFGAMYLDGGLTVARELIERGLNAKMQGLSGKVDLKDPKTRLQEYLQAHKLPLPEYAVTATHGDEHNQRFEVQCVVSCLAAPVMGEGSSRRRAEQAAAQQALEQLP